MTRAKGEWNDFRSRVAYDADALMQTYIKEPQKPGQLMLAFRTELGERFGLSEKRVEEIARRWGWVPHRQTYQKVLKLVGKDDSEMTLKDWLGGDEVADWLHGKHLMMMRDIRTKLEASLKIIPDDDPTKLNALILAYDRFRRIPVETPKDAPQMEDARVSNTQESDRLDELESVVDQYVPPAPGMYEQDLVKEAESRERVKHWTEIQKQSEDHNHILAGGDIPDAPGV